jgi:hypothetical protein
VNYSGASPIGAWNGSAYDGITGAIASGRNGGTWDGASGIVTTQPQALTGVTTVGVSEASSALGLGVGATGTWRGEIVDDTTVLIRYTYAGDTNLSGDITGDDYFLIDAGYAGAASGYGNGDLDLSGSVNADDYFVIDSNYNKAVIPLAAPLPSAAASSEGMFFAQPAKAFAPASDSQTDQKLLDELL